MKKLINSPDRVVDEALAGMVAAHGDLIRVESPNIAVSYTHLTLPTIYSV